MRQEHKWSLEELDSMIPFERDIYFGQLGKWLKDKAEAMKAK